MSLRDIERASIRAFLESHSDLFGTRRVLDYGCGQQPYRQLIEDAGGFYTGYDRRCFPANVSHADEGDAPRGEWDVIVLNQVDQYVEDIASLMRSIYGLLVPGGFLLMTGPTNWPLVESEDRRRLTPSGASEVVTQAGILPLQCAVRAEIEALGERWALGYGLLGRKSRSCIYGLSDPSDALRRIRYVGQTTCPPWARLRQHVSSAYYQGQRRGKQEKLWSWIREIDCVPSMHVLELDPDDVDAAERSWIGRFRNEGNDLRNATNGGSGRRRGYTISDSECQRRHDYRHSDEAREKISSALTGKTRGQEFRQKMRDVALARPKMLSEEQVAAIRTSGSTGVLLAKQYGVSQSLISAIRTGRRYAG